MTNEMTSGREEVYRGFTREELKAAFERVEPAGNWKLEIDATIRVGLAGLAASSKLLKAAVAFYTGSVATVALISDSSHWTRGRPETESVLIRVTAAGYYRTIGA